MRGKAAHAIPIKRVDHGYDDGQIEKGRDVAAARYAFDEGGRPEATAQDRGRILFRIAAKLREQATQLAELESRNYGKPIVESKYDIADAATCFQYYGGLANKISGQVNPVPDNALGLSLKEPVAVAGHLSRFAHGQSNPRRGSVGQSHAAHVCGSTVRRV